MDIINSFPGYEFVYDEKDKQFHNIYRGTDVGKGGYVYSESGIYGNVALLDVASMHPHSILALNYFGDYTPRFKSLIDTRIAIKHRDFDAARKMFDGKLAKYLDDEDSADMLSKALKLPINGSYGLTAANFDNPMRDIRNKNNIVALRGALFMRTLQDEVKARGYTVCHIKTDSIKIPDATPEIVEFVMEFGRTYGYEFEFEALYDKMCLVNDSTYVAKYADEKKCNELFGFVPGDNKKHPNTWTATAKQFQVPYVFKTLFSKEPVELKDMCETFSVKTALYLDMNESLPDVSDYEKEVSKLEDRYKKGKLSDITFETECSKLNELIAEGHDYRFIGKVGLFCPVKPGKGGGVLCREQNGKYYAATGTTGFRWLESELLMIPGNEVNIDDSYYRKLVDDAVDAISKHGDFEWFVSDDPYNPEPKEDPLPDFMKIPDDVTEDEIPWD